MCWLHPLSHRHQFHRHHFHPHRELFSTVTPLLSLYIVCASNPLYLQCVMFCMALRNVYTWTMNNFSVETLETRLVCFGDLATLMQGKGSKSFVINIIKCTWYPSISTRIGWMKQMSVVHALMSSIFLAWRSHQSRKPKLVCISLYCTTGPNKSLKLVCNWPECTVY